MSMSRKGTIDNSPKRDVSFSIETYITCTTQLTLMHVHILSYNFLSINYLAIYRLLALLN